jgi:hypothetical protein
MERRSNRACTIPASCRFVVHREEVDHSKDVRRRQRAREYDALMADARSSVTPSEGAV